jgi:hypothetical protein
MNKSRLSAAARRLTHVLLIAAGPLVAPPTALAQRQLHWDQLEVEAHLDAAGNLNVAETHVMVFSGDWNGGERQFRLRDGQSLRMLGMSRFDGREWQPLTEDGSLDDVDEYGWSDGDTLRWRSRRRRDPPFDRTHLRYQLRYVLSGILKEKGGAYRLKHDFAFPYRAGVINRFSLRLTFAPDWQPQAGVRPEYIVSGLAPGRGFVLDVPLHFAGATPPLQRLPRRPEIETAVAALLVLTALAVAWFFIREQRLGRFASFDVIDEPWLREHVLRYPPEVVGAAWDAAVDRNEVAALVARLVSEGVLESGMEDGDRATGSVVLRLRVDRSTLSGYERTLVDGLFFDDRNETSPAIVRDHYKGEGFNPASRIRDELRARAAEILPQGEPPRSYRWVTALLFASGIVFLWLAWLTGDVPPERAFVWGVCGVLLALAGRVASTSFRTRLDWGRQEALLCLLPALLVAGAAAAWLWFYGDAGAAALRPITVLAFVTLAYALVCALIDALKTQQSAQTLAFRQALTAVRAFFKIELEKARPALRNEWYPWLLALGLGPQAEAWSADAAFERSRRTLRRKREDAPHWSTGAEPEPTAATTWEGFGGGRSGGAGGGASWAATAGAFAASVPASRSETGARSGFESRWSSSDSRRSSSYSSSDSSSSSSGGGGGGGW